jgi:hypothetical protein
MSVALEQPDHRAVEGGQTLGRRCAGPERRRTPQKPLLELPLVLVQQGDGDRGDARVAPIKGADVTST